MIYFARIGTDGPIKIGHSANTEARLRELRSAYQAPMSLLMTSEGGEPEERRLHGRFERYRIRHTEQFRPGPELTDFVGLPGVQGWESVREAKMRRPTQIRLTKPELESLHQIQADYGLPSLSAAIKYVIRYLYTHREEFQGFRDSTR